jgi:TusA-related sulfurtransferase
LSDFLKGAVRMSEIFVDVTGENCPVPLVEMRKALKKAEVGDEVVLRGTHSTSKKEIPMAVEALGHELVEISQDGEVWLIRIRKAKG